MKKSEDANVDESAADTANEDEDKTTACAK